MATATTTEQKPYVLKSERDLPTEQQTIFFIRPLSAVRLAAIDDSTRLSDQTLRVAGKTQSGEDIVRETPLVANTSHMRLERVRHGLVNWVRLKNEDGTDCPFSMSNQDANLDRIVPYLDELDEAITELTKLSGEAVKN